MFTRCKVSVCQYKSAAHVYRDWAHHRARVSRLVMALTLLTLTVTTPCSLVNIATLQHLPLYCSAQTCSSLRTRGTGQFL